MCCSPGLKRTKIIVTDSGGVDHQFVEVEGDIEQYLTIKGESGGVEILSRSFEGKDLVEVETMSIFLNPRRIDIVFMRDEEEEIHGQ